ncbi:MAG TPA: helix-turn-helix transcriptional regulator [Anaeromyxobacter sp.]|nr:helix-turn-helix transcriptional regulator [Anaeromyxobacter sp.]
MPPRENVDAPTRERIRAWLWHYKRTRDWTNQQLADALAMKNPTITNVLNGKRTAGLDLVIAMHRRLHRSADDLLDVDPPAEPRRAGPRSPA